MIQLFLITVETEAWGDSDLFTLTRGGCCKGRNRNPVSQPPTWETQLLCLIFQATYPHLLEPCICSLPTPPGHCPTLEGCKQLSFFFFMDSSSLTAQQRESSAQGSPPQNFQASTAEGKGMPLGTLLGTSGGKKVCLFSSMHWKLSNCTRLFSRRRV